MKTIYVIVAKKQYGEEKRMIRAFESEAEAMDASGLIESCDPRTLISIEPLLLQTTPGIVRGELGWEYPTVTYGSGDLE